MVLLYTMCTYSLNLPALNLPLGLRFNSKLQNQSDHPLPVLTRWSGFDFIDCWLGSAMCRRNGKIWKFRRTSSIPCGLIWEIFTIFGRIDWEIYQNFNFCNFLSKIWAIFLFRKFWKFHTILSTACVLIWEIFNIFCKTDWEIHQKFNFCNFWPKEVIVWPSGLVDTPCWRGTAQSAFKAVKTASVRQKQAKGRYLNRVVSW